VLEDPLWLASHLPAGYKGGRQPFGRPGRCPTPRRQAPGPVADRRPGGPGL